MDSFELFHCQSPTPLLASFYERSCEGFCILQVEALLTNKNHNILDLLSFLQLVLMVYMASLCYHLYSTIGEWPSLYQLELGMVVGRIYYPTPSLGVPWIFLSKIHVRSQRTIFFSSLNFSFPSLDSINCWVFFLRKR